MDTTVCAWNDEHVARTEDMLLLPWSGQLICPNCTSLARLMMAPA